MMTMRRFIAFMATASLIFALAACGGGGGKNSATKTATSKTPSSTVTGTITPKTTATGKETTGAATPTSQGGEAQATPPAGQATTQSDATVVRPTRISGEHIDYRVQFTVASDPANLQPLVEQDRFPSRLTVTIGPGAISIQGDLPFIEVDGTIDASGAFSANGTDTIDPYDNVEATFQGTINNGELTGTYALGTNGALPGGQPITYNVTGTNLTSGG
jgi:hypothetical protein